jgi:hypothetical protein
MALAPGVYARNRMFDLFASPAVQRAKSRAATLRGVVRQLGRASDPRLSGESEFVLRYEIPALRLARVVELTTVELATLRILAERAGVTCLASEASDRERVEGALARLLLAGGDTGNLARAAHDVARTSSTPPPAE